MSDSHDEHGLHLLSDNVREIIPEAASDLHPGQVALPMDGGLDPALLAAHSSAVEPNTGLTSLEACNPGPRTHIRLLALVRSLSSQPSQAGLR